MRPTAVLGVAMLLAGCASPFDNFGDFIGDTHTINRNSNQPIGNSANILRATGRPVALPPLQPEPGNIWPGPIPPVTSLEDLEKQQGNQPPAELPFPATPPGQPTPNMPSTLAPGQAPPAPIQRAIPRGSSSPPPSGPVLPSAPAPGGPTVQAPPPLPTTPTPGSRTLTTPQGPVTTTPGANGITTFTAPGGGTGIVVPNGNGTSTLIGPDGSVTTVPAPK